MARRRRKRNPLLMRILLISLAAHAIALPVAAHFGAFEKIKREFGTSRVVMVSLPPVMDEKPPAEAKKPKKSAPATTKKSGGAAPKATAAQKAGVPQPKVVASGGTGDGSGDGPTVDANATGEAGVVPTGPTSPTAPVNPNPEPQASPTPPEKKPEPAAPTKPVEPPKPESKPPAKPEPPAAPKARRVVEAEVLEAPEPTIPDELRAEPFEKTLVVEADVDTGGHPTNVKVVESTHVAALDSAGLDAARRYRFRAASVDGESIVQHVRFRIVFKVE